MEGVGDAAKCHEGFGKEVVVVVEALALKGPRKVRGISQKGSRRKKGGLHSQSRSRVLYSKSYGVYWFTELNLPPK